MSDPIAKPAPKREGSAAPPRNDVARICTLAALAAALSGCATGGHRMTVRPAPRTAAVALQANFTQAQLALIERHCPLGRPRLDAGFGFGPTRFVIRDGFVLEHSSADKIPIWVCEGVTVEQIAGSEERTNAFKPDPMLPAGERSELKDYKGTGLDRGHMAPAANQSVDARLKAETFFLSNMAPQQPDMNRQIWNALEAEVRDWLRTRGGGHVITGGFFYDPAEDDASTADGLIEHGEIGSGVAVPTHFYKIVAVEDQDGGWDAIAFVMENRKYVRPFDFATFIRSIDWIEERAGVDFMPDLDAELEEAVEVPVPALWE